MSKDKVRETSFRGDSGKHTFILGIGLESQTHGQHKATDGADESRKKRVEGVGAHQATVDELNNASEQDISQVDVHQLQLLGCLSHVLMMEAFNDCLYIDHFFYIFLQYSLINGNLI